MKKKSLSALMIISMVMLISPILGVPLLLAMIVKSKSYSRGYAIPFGILYGTIGYNMYCKYEPDLVRYIERVQRMQGTSLEYIIKNDRNFLYVRDVLFWIIAQTGDAYILPFVIGFVTYTCIFYVFFDTVKRSNILEVKKGKLYVLFVAIVMVGITPAFSVIGNIRCVSAFVVISTACYRDLVQKKKGILTTLLYILPIGMHVAAIALIIVRLFIKVIPFVSNKFIKFCIPIILFFPLFIDLFYELLNKYKLVLVTNMINKAYVYLHWTSGGFVDKAYQFASTWIVLFTGVPFVAIMMYYGMRQKNLKNNSDIKSVWGLSEFNTYYCIVAILALGSLWIKAGAFWRFEAIVVFFSPILLFNCIKENNGKITKLILGVFILGIAMFCLFSLLFVRWIHMDMFVSGVITTCPLYLILKCIYVLL